MFGYITPLVCELKVGEHNLYKAIYCGLCRNLKKKYGGFFTSFLSYDMVFFTILSIGFFNDEIKFEKKFCPLHPFKKRICLKNCDSLNTACDLTIIFSYFKLKDQISDEKMFKKTLAKLFLFFFNKPFQKALNKQQFFTKTIKNYIENQKEIENSKAPSIDAACHPTAQCLGLIFETFSPHENEKQNLHQFGYLIGRFIYLIDAIDDYDKDYKLKNFNPFISPEHIKNNTIKNQTDSFSKAFFSINFTIAQLACVYNEIKIQNLKSIVDNIVFFGLKATQKRIFKKHNKIDLFNKLSSSDF